MQITRTFTHRAYGPIATATLAHGNVGWTLDGKPLPQASVEYLLGFALQSLQDAYAGAKSPETAKAAYAAKHNRLIEGTVGARRQALQPMRRRSSFGPSVVRACGSGVSKGVDDVQGVVAHRQIAAQIVLQHFPVSDQLVVLNVPGDALVLFWVKCRRLLIAVRYGIQLLRREETGAGGVIKVFGFHRACSFSASAASHASTLGLLYIMD